MARISKVMAANTATKIVNAKTGDKLNGLVEQQAGLDVGEFVWTGGDVHLYLNHLDQAREQLSRKTRRLLMLLLNKATSIFDYNIGDFTFVGYDPHPAIKADVSV